MKRVTAISCLVFFAISLMAHEFWMQPEKYLYEKGALINIRFWVGENFEGENWKGNRDKVQALRIYTKDFTDTIDQLINETPGDSMSLALFDEGTAMFTLQTNNSFIELEAAKFNDYLKEDGLLNVLDYRKASGLTDSIGKEYYQRNVKTIVQVGKQTDEAYKKTTTLPLDIIPLKNPYAIKKQDSMYCTILFRQQPLANQLVNIWHRQNDKTEKQKVYTNESGQIGFAITHTGKWMVSTVKMEAVLNDPADQWQSYWGSCTWGYY